MTAIYILKNSKLGKSKLIPTRNGINFSILEQLLILYVNVRFY
jgi:hypothetical protein